MPPDTVLHQKLSEAARRIRVLLVYQWTTRLLFWTTLGCLLWLFASKAAWLPEPSAEALVGVLALAASAGVGIGLARRITPMDAARLMEQRTEMKERLSSAVEFGARANGDPLAWRQIEDANAHAKAINIRQVYPLRLSRETVGFLALALVLLGAFFLPTISLFWPAEQKREMEQVKQHGAAMEKIARDHEKAAAEKRLEETKKAAKEARKLAEAMKRGQMSKKGAMIQMRKLTRQMQEQQKRLATASTPGTKSLEQAAEEVNRALEQQQKAAQEVAKAKQGERDEMKGAQAQQRQQSQPSQAMQQAQQALQNFADALATQNLEAQNQALQEVANQMQTGQMTPQEMQQLQKQIQALSQALKRTDLDRASQQLAEMAQRMQPSNLDPETLKRLAELLRQAGGACLTCGQRSLDAKQLAALLEALKNGRLQLAMGNRPGRPPGPGLGKSRQQGSGPGGGKGGSGAGLAPAPFQPEEKSLKIAKRAPNAKVSGQRSSLQDSSLTIAFKSDPDRKARLATPYYQVYQQRKRLAESVVEKENIPAPVRRLVKDYFESIKP